MSKAYSLFVKLKSISAFKPLKKFSIAFYADDKILGSYMICKRDESRASQEIELSWTGVIVLVQDVHDYLYINFFDDVGHNVSYGRCSLRDGPDDSYPNQISRKLTIYGHSIEGTPKTSQWFRIKLKMIIQPISQDEIAKIVSYLVYNNPEISTQNSQMSIKEDATKDINVQRLLRERNSFYRQARIKNVIGSACLQNFYPVLKLAYNGLFDPSTKLVEKPLHYNCILLNEVPENRKVRLTNVRRAVVIGLNYSKKLTTNPKCPQLRGSENDAHNVHKFLSTFLGYTEVTLIRDREGTAQTILTSIAHMLREASRGDVFFFSFSGHGRSQEIDGGRAICAIDRDISDAQLRSILIDLCPEGVKMTILLDACHSGYFFRLPYRWYKPNWYTNPGKKEVRADIVSLAACDVFQKSHELGTGSSVVTGRFSTLLIVAIIGFPMYHTYETLIRHINRCLSKLRDVEGQVQMCTMESTKPFYRCRKVNFVRGIICTPDHNLDLSDSDKSPETDECIPELSLSESKYNSNATYHSTSSTGDGA